MFRSKAKTGPSYAKKVAYQAIPDKIFGTK